jgi:TolB-like protein
MMDKVKRILIGILFLVFALFSGCGTKVSGDSASFFISPEYDFSFIKRIAVLPFENLTNEKNAGFIIMYSVSNAFLVSNLVDVALPGDALNAFYQFRVSSGNQLSSQQLNQICNTLKVQAVVTGSINKYELKSEGYVTYPEISFTMMMVDCESGNIIWSISKSTEKPGVFVRHFGAKSETLNEALDRLVKEAVGTFKMQ